jgi:hypothetical protein
VADAVDPNTLEPPYAQEEPPVLPPDPTVTVYAMPFDKVVAVPVL